MLVLLIAAAQDVDALIATAHARLQAEAHCPIDADVADITVCGRRSADRYRVTFVQRSAAPEQSVSAERARLLNRTNPVQDLSPFLVGGGFAGVTVGRSFGPGGDGGATHVEGRRPLAP
ncbi:hypothetical protein [Sphingomonas sp.]|uniref:hypothetical protein n=1 Tax=Sphingomonas sp. TaxID=28214 RepID=UPI0035BC8234